MTKAKRYGLLLVAACTLTAVFVPTGTAAPKPPTLTITGFAAEPVPPELRPSYWADDGRYITTGSVTWTSRPHTYYFLCLKNLTAPFGPHGYDRGGCISMDTGNHFSWSFDPNTFPNDVGGADGGFYAQETIGLYILAARAHPHTGTITSSNIVYETIQ